MKKIKIKEEKDNYTLKKIDEYCSKHLKNNFKM